MSKGVHLVMPREAIDADTGMIVRTEKSVLFFIPWGEDRWIVGTTDTDWSGDRAEPTATADDVAYILSAANRVLAKPLTSADVLAVYAGLRPLIADPEGGTSAGSALAVAENGRRPEAPRGSSPLGAPRGSPPLEARGPILRRPRSRPPSCPASTWSIFPCQGWPPSRAGS